MPTTIYNFYVQNGVFCKTNETHTPITPDTAPIYRFGDKITHNLSFPHGTIAKDDILQLAMDCDYLSGGVHGSMSHAQYVVSQEDANNQTVSIDLDTRWEKFLGEVNGKHNPVRCNLELCIIGAGDICVVLAEGPVWARPILRQPGDPDVELEPAKYYTKDEINAVMGRFEDEIGNAEEATEKSRIWSEGTPEQVAELGGEKSAKGHAEAATQFATAAGTAKTGAETARDAAKIIAEGTPEQVAPHGLTKSAKGHAEAAAQSATEAGTAKNGAETARDAAKVIAEGTPQQVAPHGLTKSAKGHAEAAAQSATAAGTAKTGAETARDKSAIWAEGTDQQVVELGGLHSAKEWTAQMSAIRDEVLTVVAEHYVGAADNYGVTTDGTLLSFTWRDPADNDVVHWKRTRLIYKQGGFPANENDGIVLLDNYERNSHQIQPFVFDMLAVSDYYFALFTQSTAGVWNTGDDAPRFTTDVLTWATIAMMSRAGTLLQYPGMAIGSVVDIQTNSLFPALRWKLMHVDYKGTFEHIEDYMLDNTRHHNSIWAPNYLPCLGDSQTAVQIQFDAPEKTYAPTWDTVFLNGKAYYTVSGETYTQLTAGTDYENGDDIATWQTTEGQTVYTKNHADRISSGCNSWLMSNIRQGLNGRGSALWTPQNEYDVASSHSFYTTGFLAGFTDGYLANVMPVRNKTARNTVSAISGGGGGGYDMTLDTFWLPSMKEVYNTNINSIAEGSQFSYFKDVATTNTDKIQVDEGGTARNVFLRSSLVSNVRVVGSIYPSGASSTNYYASLAYAFLPCQCVA